MDLVCCVCAFAGRGRPSDAETVIRGYAVCVPHASLVAHGDPVLDAARSLLQDRPSSITIGGKGHGRQTFEQAP